jgi:predicted nucleotidyltransferase
MSSGNPQASDNLKRPLSKGKSSGKWQHPSHHHCIFRREYLTIGSYHSPTGVPMMGIQELLKAKRNEILDLAAKHGATKVRLIGSVARREETQESDIDFLVEMESDRSLLDHAALILDLEALLGRKVDIASDRGLRPRVRERVLQEAIPL